MRTLLGPGKRFHWLALATLVSGLLLASLDPSSGVSEALACTAGASSEDEGPSGVAALYQPQWPAPIDDSGFFAFAVGTRGIDPEAALEAIAIEVRDREKQPVAGKATLLDYEAGTPSSYDSAWIGWQADAPLEPNQKLSFSATATNSEGTVSMSGTLVASGPAPALGEPEATFEPWVETTLDTGEILDCGECASFGIELRTRYHSLVNLADSRPAINVAWKYSIEAIRGKGDLVEGSTVRVTSPLSSVSDVAMDVDFEDELDEYCVRVTAEDLRSGEEYSQEACDSPEAPLPKSFSDGIAYCPFVAVPEGLRARYCSYAENAYDQRCAPYLETAGAGGSDSGGSDSGGSDSGGSPGGGSDAEAPAAPRKSQSGCDVGAGPESGSAFAGLVALGALAFSCARRRRRSSRHSGSRNAST